MTLDISVFLSALPYLVGFVILVIIGMSISMTDSKEPEKEEADKRAWNLLMGHLSWKQRWQLKLRGFIELSSRLRQERTYRMSRHGRVWVYERGKYAGSLCVAPAIPLPEADLVLAHMLMIEGNEAEYLAIARFQPRSV